MASLHHSVLRVESSRVGGLQAERSRNVQILIASLMAPQTSTFIRRDRSLCLIKRKATDTAQGEFGQPLKGFTRAEPHAELVRR